MRCHRARRLLARKESQSISGREERILSGHLSICRECAGLEDQLERTWNALSYHPQIEPSPGFLAALRRKLRAEPVAPESRQPRQFHLRWQWVALAAGILLAAILLTRDRPISGPSPTAEPGIKIAADRDRGDEQFLEELERILQRSDADYLATYDSWPGVLQETGSLSPAKKGPVASSLRKEIS
jgi:hypothetical protein